MGEISYRPRYTIADYLLWEGDWELWEGIPVSMSPSPNFWHQHAAGQLVIQVNSQLSEAVSCSDCFVVHEVDWHVNSELVVRPDVSVVCGDRPGDYIKSSPVVVAEFLSPSTRDKDLNAKRSLYALHKVPFYIIGDVEEKSLALLRLADDGYEECDSWELDLHEGCSLTIDPTKIFR